MKRHFKPQTYERRVVSSCLKKVNIYKRFLKLVGLLSVSSVNLFWLFQNRFILFIVVKG